MDAVKYFKEKARMTGNCSAELCINCLLSSERNGSGRFCSVFEMSNPEEAVKIVEKWSKQHPPKTRKQDFFEKYPNAPRDEKGYPKRGCCIYLGYYDNCKPDSTEGCYDCWDEPVGE